MNVANNSAFNYMAMIQELTIKNFLSFKESTTFSFEATNDNTLEDAQVVQIGNTRLLRFGLVYGANASGKSNLLAAFDFLHRFWRRKKQAKDETIGVAPFKLDQETPNKPSSFELVFFVEDVKYKYELELDNRVVYNERLSYYKTTQPTLLLNRTLDNGVSVIKLHADLKVSKATLEELSLKCLPNMSFFAASEMVNYTQPQIEKVFIWMNNNIAPVLLPESSVFEFAERKLLADAKIKNYVLGFMRHADFNVTNLKTELRKVPLTAFEELYVKIKAELTEDEKEDILNNGFEEEQTFFEHTVLNNGKKEVYLLPSTLQSSGTRRTIGVEAAIYQTQELQAFLAIDEIESSLHPELIEYILTRFLQEKGRSQLLIATHYDPLLDEVGDLFRRDMVWFTEKGEGGATKLYSLSDFKGLNKISSFRKFYRNGRFGALPNIG